MEEEEKEEEKEEAKENDEKEKEEAKEETKTKSKVSSMLYRKVAFSLSYYRDFTISLVFRLINIIETIAFSSLYDRIIVLFVLSYLFYYVVYFL